MPSRKLAENERLDALREEIAEAIALVKAYNVPALCVKLGLLAQATEEDQTEAFRSKRAYVRPMLRDLGEADLLRIAERTLEEIDHPALELVVTEMTKHADHRVSILVRKDVLAALNGAGPLFGDQPILDTLERIFGSQVVVGERLATYSNQRGGPITQWYIRNDDWSHQQMLEHCGALDCPQATFFKLLEAVLHPLARRDEEQSRLAAKVSDCLRRDGFVMRATSSQSGYPILEVVRAALVPQVYLHYDPYTRRERGQEQVLARQRMDFLLLLDNGLRVVVEVDGQHHYATEIGGKYHANPALYAAMAAEDRRLRLAGYEVYRFGGYEFSGLAGPALDVQSTQLVADFFERLFKRHGVAA